MRQFQHLVPIRFKLAASPELSAHRCALLLQYKNRVLMDVYVLSTLAFYATYYLQYLMVHVIMA